MAQILPAQADQGTGVDNTNHDLLHTLSVRLDAQWHERSYEAETKCDGCRRIFDRLREMDREAVQMLSRELSQHIRMNKFPLDIAD